ncbi:MAG: transposase [Lachnospiraceae bacterium]|nr:transposase [Lachnospiraceae bacterium]
MLIGKKVCLQPNKAQAEAFSRFAGTGRFAWNESLAFYMSVFRDEGRYATLSDMIHHLQELKHNDSDYAWLNAVPEAITKQAIKDLLKAFKSYYNKRKQPGYVPYTREQIEHAARIGKELTGYDQQGHPKFKKRGKCMESFYQRTDNVHKTDDTHIKITGIKKPVRCTALQGIDLPEHIQNPRITFNGKYWYLSYSYEVDDADVIEDPQREVLAVDLGIKDLAITSDGKHYRNINKDPEIKRLRKRLKHIQRLISHKYEANAVTDKNGKKVYHKTNNIKKLEHTERMIYRRIRNIQQAYMYEVINSMLRTKARTVVLEDLNVKGMLQNPKLAKAIQEERLYEFRRIMGYKCERNGTELVIADRWFPSSKRCSCCGNIKHGLKLRDRTYICDVCGLVMDRDENAALNLEQYPGIIKGRSKAA